MSTLELEHLKHSSSSSNNLTTHSDGSLTLASLNVTGDLAVDTTTLKVDSTNNRVGIGTAPDRDLHIKGAAGDPVHLKLEGDPADYARIMFDNGTNDNIGEIRYNYANDTMTFNTFDVTRLTINNSGHTIATAFKPDKYEPLIGPVTITGGFVNGAATSTWHSITNVDINNYAGGYSSGNVGIHGEIHWTSGTVSLGYNHTVRFMLPPNSSNTAGVYSSGNFSSFSFSGNIYNTIPCVVTHHTGMTSNHDIRLRLRNSTGTDYDPLRLEILASTAPNSSGAKLTLWRG